MHNCNRAWYLFLSDWFVMMRGPQWVREAGSSGMAPACVQT